MIIQPADCSLVVLQPNGLAVLLCSVLALFRMSVVVPTDIAATDAKDVTLPQRSSLPLQAFFDLRYWDLVATDRRRRVTVLLLVPEHAVSKLRFDGYVDGITSSANRQGRLAQQYLPSHTSCEYHSWSSAQPPRAINHYSTFYSSGAQSASSCPTASLIEC
jgi:hypothetical protein